VCLQSDKSAKALLYSCLALLTLLLVVQNLGISRLRLMYVTKYVEIQQHDLHGPITATEPAVSRAESASLGFKLWFAFTMPGKSHAIENFKFKEEFVGSLRHEELLYVTSLDS
jgi:hypothetical protein